jgi:Protein of unknown function (Hypoth_ymh)
MAKTRLDKGLLKKVAKKTAKTQQYVREQVSKRASRQNVASEAALIIWAKELGFGTAAAQRQLDPHIQQQVSSVGSIFPSSSAASRSKVGVNPLRATRAVSPLRASIEYLLSDPELRTRCADLLMARKSFDRVFREATVVLDARLKHLGKIKGKVNPAELVARVLHPSKAILIVSEHPDEQRGFFELFSGLMAAFRNPAHHTLNDKLTREDALRFCGFVDSLLTLLGKARISGTASP